MERNTLKALVPAPLRGLRWRLRWLRRTDAYAAAPLRLLGRAARFTLSELIRRDITFTTPDGLPLRTMRNNFSSFAMCTVGERDPEMCRFIERHVPAGGTFVDAGANIGAYSLAAARKIGPSGRLLAFEAHPRTHGFLRANLDMNGFSGARTFQVALGAEEGRIALDFHDANPGETHVAAASADRGPPAIRMRRLDDVLREEGIGAIDYLKIDVEGFELPVLQGAMGILAASPRVAVQTEMEERHAARYGHGLEDIVRVMARLGLQPHRIAPDGTPGPITGPVRGEVVAAARRLSPRAAIAGASRHAAHRRARAGMRGRSRGTMFNCALPAKCSRPVAGAPAPDSQR